MSTRLATLILFAGGILGGVVGWRLASLLGKDFLGLIHFAGAISGTWIGLLVSFLMASQLGRWRRSKRRKVTRPDIQ